MWSAEDINNEKLTIAVIDRKLTTHATLQISALVSHCGAEDDFWTAVLLRLDVICEMVVCPSG